MSTKNDKLTTPDIIKNLHTYYRDNSQYVIANSYVYNRNWESDIFVLNKSGYSYEFEVKVSRADFKGDLKKVQKHQILQAGKTLGEDFLRPNRFYYAVPKDMVKVEEVPEYAGLIYMEKYGFEKIKEAPLLHKYKFNFNDILCPKFYFHNYNLKYENFKLSEQNKYLRDRFRWFDFKEIDKLKPARLRNIIKTFQYKDYLKFMIDFGQQVFIVDKLHEAGAVKEIQNDIKPMKHKYDYVCISDRYRPLSELEFKTFKKQK